MKRATDWRQIAALYGVLLRLDDNPVVALNHAVRGHLLEMAGDRTAALEAYRAAARVATNLQQERYLNQQITRLQAPPEPPAMHRPIRP